MYLERLLQINIATMATLGTLLLGLGQRNATLPLGMLIAAIAAVWLTDVTGWLRLNRQVTNVAATGAFFFFLWQVLQLGGWLERILGIGDFLVYLQVILLLQKKDTRTYGSLALLSLVQVVVAAAFYQQVLFGVLLVAYLFVGLSALVLLFVYGERSRHHSAQGPAPVAVATVRRWPLAGQEPIFADATGSYAGQGGMGRELRARVVGMGLGTLALTLGLFCILPRWGHQPWRGALGDRPTTVGFSEQVSLGELGQIIESPEEVLRICFFDSATGEPSQVGGEVYLRGTVLTRYALGAWSREGAFWPAAAHPLRATAAEPPEHSVRQRITIEPLDQPELFCVWPFFATQASEGVFIDPAREVLLRTPDQMGRRYVYELGTTAFGGGLQSALVPVQAWERVHIRALRDLPATDGALATPSLVALADSWVAKAGIDRRDHVACARLLERQLRDSGQFQYSLGGQPRDPSLDPIEDFVTTNPRGHCEYFATALVLMLRSQGIPARMVVGFKTDEWNRLGRYFQVRQLHAHTWVEAYLGPEQLAARPDLARASLDAPYGAWLRLDPTPAASGPQLNSLLDRIGRSFDWLNFLWANYVIEMDQPRQREAIYEPLSGALAQTARRLADLAWWRNTLSQLAAALGTGLRNLIVGMTIAVALVALLLAGQAVRLWLRRRRSRRALQAARGLRSAGTGIEFYHRLEALLARRGLRRACGQTQREFAREAGRKMAQSAGQRHLAELPGQVVEAFYRVRFGGLALDSPQAEAVEHALRQIRQGAGRRGVEVGSGE